MNTAQAGKPMESNQEFMFLESNSIQLVTGLPKLVKQQCCISLEYMCVLSMSSFTFV